MQQETLATVETADPMPFDKFWSIYPKKVAPEVVRDLYDKLSDYEQIEIGQKSPALFYSWRFREKRHILNPTTFIRQKRWHDEPDAEPGTTGGQRQASQL